mmetsp:Transcript_76507/g.115155  ORF Transcript_76507/g.115155 Transcript_76507/m.115155 type:complete len:90 (+) Transcript_76507:45-314(+)
MHAKIGNESWRPIDRLILDDALRPLDISHFAVFGSLSGGCFAMRLVLQENQDTKKNHDSGEGRTKASLVAGRPQFGSCTYWGRDTVLRL